MPAFTEKQKSYIEARRAGLKPNAAAIEAGYSTASAERVAISFEKRPDFQRAIKKTRNSVGSPGVLSSEVADSYLHDHYDTPLDLFLHLMNEPKAPKGLRIEAAKIAAPFVHGKVQPAGGKGKKEQLQERVNELRSTSKRRPRSAPNRSIN